MVSAEFRWKENNPINSQTEPKYSPDLLFRVWQTKHARTTRKTMYVLETHQLFGLAAVLGGVGHDLHTNNIRMVVNLSDHL